MRLFRTNKYQKMFEIITTLIIVVNFLGCMVIPQVVNAQTHEIVTILPITKYINNTKIIPFPISGERKTTHTIWVVVTAYSSTPDQTDSTPCVTANGYNLCNQYKKQNETNTIAANFLPFGQQVRLPELFGNKIFVVRDHMNERYGYGRIDLWLPTREQQKNSE